MLVLERTSDADSDLYDIWLYIAEDQPVNADRFLDKLNEVAHKLAEFPMLGRERPKPNHTLPTH